MVRHLGTKGNNGFLKFRLPQKERLHLGGAIEHLLPQRRHRLGGLLGVLMRAPRQLLVSRHHSLELSTEFVCDPLLRARHRLGVL